MAASVALRRSGMLVTCFDVAADPGGIWCSDTRSAFSTRGYTSPIHPTLRCSLPKDLLAFSDMRFDYTVPQFPHHTSMRRYLELYAEKKGIRSLTRFNTKVQSARYNASSNLWHLITVNVVNGDVYEWSFDKVRVCTDQTHEPRYPSGELKRSGADVFHCSCSGTDVGHCEHEGEGYAVGVRGHTSGMRDVASAAVQLLTRFPGWRNDTKRGNQIVSRWLRLRSNVLLGSIPEVGAPLGCDGKGILFLERPPNSAECTSNAGAFTAENPPQSNGIFIDNVDAVVCATGYNVRYPFLHCELREVLEESPLLLPQQVPDGPGTCAENLSNDVVEAKMTLATKPRPIDCRGLYLGTLFAHNPTIAFVGMQKGLLPPFLLFEAQAKFIAYAFTNRLSLPSDTALLLARQSKLLERDPLLRHLYSSHGLGIYSSIYFNVLHEELQVGSRDTYTSCIMERQRWLLTTGLLRLVHKFRSLAPLKRKQQHVLFSNDV
uniref:Flavin-containing monooxygenase n=1 Tax=Trypanosoma vivax (strain Y486) TaxID=1055687 RepID=G0TVC7_TRYVY|nr:conserved hypothetical protein, fragment [Trypanosoma vivax Y486]